MNLIEVQKQLEEKNKKRNQLVGQKEMLMDHLKEVGYESIKEAKKARKKFESKKQKLKETYQRKETEFKEKYEELLNAD
jgi:hypothetical protein